MKATTVTLLLIIVLEQTKGTGNICEKNRRAKRLPLYICAAARLLLQQRCYRVVYDSRCRPFYTNGHWERDGRLFVERRLHSPTNWNVLSLGLADFLLGVGTLPVQYRRDAKTLTLGQYYPVISALCAWSTTNLCILTLTGKFSSRSPWGTCSS